MASPSKSEIKRLKSGGLMKQKHPNMFAVRLKVIGGSFTTDKLRTLAEAADQFGKGEVHLTVRQGAEIPHVRFEDVEPLREFLKRGGLSFGACGPRIRTITACPGDWCSHGVIKPQALAAELSERFADRSALPHKFKVAITGCPYGSCVKPQENDLGIMGVAGVEIDNSVCGTCGLCLYACPSPETLALKDGMITLNGKKCLQCGTCASACPQGAITAGDAAYVLYVGGKMGKKPRTAERLPISITSDDELYRIVDAVIDWYAENGNRGERFGATLDRIGTEALTASLTEKP